MNEMFFFVITIHNLISFISQKNTANIKGLRENSEYLLKNSNQELVSVSTEQGNCKNLLGYGNRQGFIACFVDKYMLYLNFKRST